MSDYRSAHERKTTIGDFEKVDVREAAVRNLSLRYDRKTGYLGYGVNSGKELFKVSAYDRVLVVRHTGVYSVMNEPEKLFVDKGMLSCGLANKETLGTKIFNVIYKDKKTGFPYMKRTRIEKYILDRSYEVVPDGSAVIALTTREDVTAVVKYKKKPKVRVLEEEFDVNAYLIKGVKAGGVRLANREVSSAKFLATK